MRLGIDIGSTNTKAVLVDSSRKVVAVSSVKTPTYRHDEDGLFLAEIHQSALDDALNKVVCELPAAFRKQVRAVGVTGQMHGMQVTDQQGQVCQPYYTWQDRRTTTPTKLTPKVLMALQEYRCKTGGDCRPGMASALLPWLLEKRALPSVPYSISFLPDHVVSSLIGWNHITDPTNAAASGLYDIECGEWLASIMDMMGLSTEILPAVVPTGQCAGPLSEKRAVQLGLPAGAPVMVGLGDFQAALIGSELSDDEVAVNVGTGAQIAVLVPNFVDDASVEVRPFYAGRYAVCHTGLPGSMQIMGADNASLQRICDEYVSVINRMAIYMATSPVCLRISGGTIRHNKQMQKMLTERTALPVQLSSYTEEAATGTALLAGDMLDAN